jgi:hypothetical protein
VWETRPHLLEAGAKVSGRRQTLKSLPQLCGRVVTSFIDTGANRG